MYEVDAKDIEDIMFSLDRQIEVTLQKKGLRYRSAMGEDVYNTLKEVLEHYLLNEEVEV